MGEFKKKSTHDEGLRILARLIARRLMKDHPGCHGGPDVDYSAEGLPSTDGKELKITDRQDGSQDCS